MTRPCCCSRIAGQRGAGRPPGRCEVERERALEGGVVAGEGVVGRTDRSTDVVDQDVDPAELLERRVHRATGVVAVGGVGDDRDSRWTARVGDAGEDRVEVGGGARRDHDGGAFARRSAARAPDRSPGRRPVITATRPGSCPTGRPYTPRHGMGFLDRSGIRGAARVDAHVRRRGDRAAVALLRRHDRRVVEARDRAAASSR